MWISCVGSRFQSIRRVKGIKSVYRLLVGWAIALMGLGWMLLAAWVRVSERSRVLRSFLHADLIRRTFSNERY